MEGLSLDPRLLYREIKSRTPSLTSPNAPDFQRLLRSTSSPRPTFPTPRHQELMKACTAFEALFIEQVLKAMRRNVGKGLVDGGFAEEVFEDMLYTEYSQKMAESGHFGIAKIMYEQLKNSL